MGKKGKARQDKFYHGAKEIGYRSRAAFKLIQLNRKFNFLERSRIVIDLCAAPGSWMQVAKQNMPMQSIVLGVDLNPIKPMEGCVALQEDITTEKCYQNIKKELVGWKADVILHDGAPNVGQNWVYDAFIQNQLVLSALKLATEFLAPGGCFVTKIFRSKDYQSLMWVLQQLFKKCQSTKPQASRMESAEIFVVCQGYKAPDKLDPKFVDPKAVFKELDTETVQKVIAKERSKPKAGGYEDGVTTLHKKALVSDFVHTETRSDILSWASEIVMNDERISNHKLTTNEIKECCKDIKVLGRKDCKNLLSWAKAVQKDLDIQDADVVQENVPMEQYVDMKDDEDEDDDEEGELARIDEQVKEMEEEKMKELKRKKKKILKERRSLQEKMRLKMVIPGDSGPGLLEKSLFGLKQIETSKDLDMLADEEAGDVEEAPAKPGPRRKKEKYNKETGVLDSSGKFYRGEKDSDEEFDINSDDEYESDVPQDSLGIDGSDDEKSAPKTVRFNVVEKEAAKAKKREPAAHPLLTDLDDGDSIQKRKQKADQWFNKGVFESIDNEDDEDIELDYMAKKYPRLARSNDDMEGLYYDDDEPEIEFESDEEKIVDKKKGSKRNLPLPEDSDDDDDDSDTSSENSDYDVHEEFAKDDGDEKTAPAAGGKPRGKKRSLTAEALAIGSMLIHSRKAKRDFINDGWNRFANNDENLPDWFAEDERKHSHKAIPVTKELVQEYRNRMKAIDARSIQKVVEAKARKKRRALHRMEKTKKKVDMIAENMGLTDYDKALQIRTLSKRMMTEKKKETTYVVAKKSTSTKRAQRPNGVKGNFKMVDKRMKKDDKTRKAAERRKGKKARGPKKK